MIETGKKILITGASSGFGYYATAMLIKRGHRVIAAVRGGLARWKGLGHQELDSALASRQLQIVDIEMTDESTFSRATAIIDQEWGGSLDVLINNAGYGAFGSAAALPIAELRKQFDVNFFGPFALLQTLLPQLRRARGRVINVSSILGRVTVPFQGAYSASKYAMESYSEAMTYDLKAMGIEIAILAPGSFRTNFIDNTSAQVLGADLGNRQMSFSHFLKQRSATMGGDPRIVAKRLVNLCEKRSIPFHSFVGGDAHFLNFLHSLLPQSWFIGLVDWLYRKFVFRSSSHH